MGSKKKNSYYSKGSKRQQLVVTRLKCTKCGNVYTHYRVEKKRKPRGHRKNIYCIICKRKVEHITII